LRHRAPGTLTPAAGYFPLVAWVYKKRRTFRGFKIGLFGIKPEAILHMTVPLSIFGLSVIFQNC
jgi:hypothetical protein